jgi:hypothetical protein
MWPSSKAAPQAHQRKDQALLSGDMSAVQVVSGKLSTEEIVQMHQDLKTHDMSRRKHWLSASAHAASIAVASCGIYYCTGGSSRDMRAAKPAGSQRQQMRRTETDVLGMHFWLPCIRAMPYALAGTATSVATSLTISLHHADDAISPPPARHPRQGAGTLSSPVSPVRSQMAVSLGTPSRSAALNLGPALTGVQQWEMPMCTASEVCMVHPGICDTCRQMLPMFKWTSASQGQTPLTQLRCACPGSAGSASGWTPAAAGVACAALRSSRQLAAAAGAL